MSTDKKDRDGCGCLLVCIGLSIVILSCCYGCAQIIKAF